MRIKLLGFACIFVFFILAAGLFNYSILHHGKYKELSEKNCIRLLPQPGSRGKIISRDGRNIADNVLTYDIMLLPQEPAFLTESIRRLAEILGVKIQDIRDRYKAGYMSPSMPVSIMKNVDRKKAIAVEEAKTGLEGVLIHPSPLRSYPYGKTAVHVLGYLDNIDHWRLTKLSDYGYKTKDEVGFGGIEEKYDYYLRQENGGATVEVDRKGRIVRYLGVKPPQSGKDIQITIDLKLQQIVEESLNNRKGCVVIMNPLTGEILAMASGPDFDPAIFIDSSSRKGIQRVLSDKDALLLNRAIKGLYPPGSIFKCIVAAAALESGKINPSTSFLCKGSARIGNKDFACWGEHGTQNLIQAIAHSCNVYFYKTGLIVGPQLIHDYAEKFGLSKPTSIELPYEGSGFIPSPLWKSLYRFRRWFDGDTANFSIGQGDVLVTPLQMARMMAVFANHGSLVQPYIVKAIDKQDVSRYHRNIVKLPLKDSTIETIRTGLRAVVNGTEGTAGMMAGLSISVAGKTGTAQVMGKVSHGWFLGFFPFQAPKFVICSFLENGGSGQVAAALTKEIIEKMIQENMIAERH